VVVSAPVEVIIDELVLRGVREADGPRVVAAFRRQLAELLLASADIPAESAGPVRHPPHFDQHPVAVRPTEEQDAEELATRLAAAVARAARAARR
jgi:hypothetical protein